MTPSESQSEKQSKSVNLPNKLLWAIAAVAFLGFLDATYLTISHYTGAHLYCGVKDTCSIVTASKYSVLYGVPVALGGALYYLTVLIGSLFCIDTQNSKFTKWLGLFTVVGLLASGWFVFVQLVLLKAICWYCMLSAATSTIIFILGMLLFSRLRKKE